MDETLFNVKADPDTKFKNIATCTRMSRIKSSLTRDIIHEQKASRIIFDYQGKDYDC